MHVHLNYTTQISQLVFVNSHGNVYIDRYALEICWYTRAWRKSFDSHPDSQHGQCIRICISVFACVCLLLRECVCTCVCLLYLMSCDHGHELLICCRWPRHVSRFHHIAKQEKEHTHNKQAQILIHSHKNKTKINAIEHNTQSIVIVFRP